MGPIRYARNPPGKPQLGGGFGETHGVAAHYGPGEAGDSARQAAVRGEADGLEDHPNAACDVRLADDCYGAAGIGAPMAPAVVREAGLVGGVIGVGELVVLHFGEAPKGNAQPTPAPDALEFEAMGQILIKQLVMADLVGGDMAADLFEDRFTCGIAQGPVVGAGAGLDDTTRDHLARTRASARGAAVEIDAKAVTKAAEGGGEIEFGIGQFGPAPQRLPMLGFLLAPAPGGFLKPGIVIENSAQMVRVGAAIQLDEARRLDDRHDLRVELAAIEPVPANIVERPRAHAAPSGICNAPYTPGNGNDPNGSILTGGTQ